MFFLHSLALSSLRAMGDNERSRFSVSGLPLSSEGWASSLRPEEAGLPLVQLTGSDETEVRRASVPNMPFFLAGIPSGDEAEVTRPSASYTHFGIFWFWGRF